MWWIPSCHHIEEHGKKGIGASYAQWIASPDFDQFVVAHLGANGVAITAVTAETVLQTPINGICQDSNDLLRR